MDQRNDAATFFNISKETFLLPAEDPAIAEALAELQKEKESGKSKDVGTKWMEQHMSLAEKRIWA